MAVCVKSALLTAGISGNALKQDGQVVDVYAFVIDPVQTNPCPNYTILSGQDFANVPTLTDIFTMPVAEDLQQMWMLGFSLPIITYLTAWGYGVVINWFNEKYHR